MKKSYILIVIFLLLASAGTFYSYKKYFLPIQSELADNNKSAKQLQNKIKSLEKTFEKTAPSVVIKFLTEEMQPWASASRKHLSYYDTEDIEKAEMPPGEIPSFWYKEEYPKIEAGLYQFARERGVHLAVLDFDIKTPRYFEKSSPSRKDVLDEVNKFNTGIAKAKFILEAKPYYLEEMVIWPDRTVLKGQSGDVVMHTTGYKMQITNENLMRFLERLNQSDTYLNVNGIKIINTSLRNPKAPYTVELLISTADVVDAKKAEN